MHHYNPLPTEFLQIGSMSWSMYGTCIGLGVLIAVILGIREAVKQGISFNDCLNAIIITVPLSVLGTRVWYVIFQWDQFNGDIGKMLDLTDGGLAIHGGIFTGFIVAIIYGKVRKINILQGIDIIAPKFLIAQAIGRWGNFFNQEAHGEVIGGVRDNVALLSHDAQRAFLSTTLHLPDFITNQMFFKGESGLHYYYPTFLYESIWNIIGFSATLLLRKTRFIRSGDLFAFYLIWYSLGRFFIEGMRTDSLYIGDTGLRTAQVTSIALIIFGILFGVVTRKLFKVPHYYTLLKEQSKKD